MENALTNLFSLVFFVFAFGINIVVIALRTGFEAIFKKLKFIKSVKLKNTFYDLWNELILPIAPIVIGALLAYFIKDYPYPAEFAVSSSGRIFFGLIAGFFSSSVYKFAKFYVKKYIPTEIKTKVDDLAKQANVNDEIPEPKDTI